MNNWMTFLLMFTVLKLSGQFNFDQAIAYEGRDGRYYAVMPDEYNTENCYSVSFYSFDQYVPNDPELKILSKKAPLHIEYDLNSGKYLYSLGCFTEKVEAVKLKNWLYKEGYHSKLVKYINGRR